ncbi:putative peroxiredoxin 6 [Toxoplasma gondii RUB]|nr:putative peroxiredoxin 6 [Toxoplasma gondii GT1]KAF4639121.1 putative peroxiredoxin 6 [Toxoplasma gondii]KFG44685.1 putative peroxiredoxin 6 [Toxoplasma gondii GAB2-2007-GAL-DOM2]KFG55685.1 putative peroxiredoxin 6 [Toxoplasma gondii FOU]KFG57768.1 putative peroxiredoxin 6 [Toxoplasma gondii RUB]KFH10116.1 putative peroxiredoxin 6 [Toxoplasma gondii VAND]PUA92035.1 putative peroxiredoxin 6 [Toxoplasma gondii TgCATBr9]
MHSHRSNSHEISSSRFHGATHLCMERRCIHFTLQLVISSAACLVPPTSCNDQSAVLLQSRLSSAATRNLVNLSCVAVLLAVTRETIWKVRTKEQGRNPASVCSACLQEVCRDLKNLTALVGRRVYAARVAPSPVRWPAENHCGAGCSDKRTFLVQGEVPVIFFERSPIKACHQKHITTMLVLGSTFPDVHADASGVPGDKIKLYDFLGDSWGLLMSHPHDFTPVCTTELAQAARMAPEFAKRNCKLIGFSCDDVSSHKGWAKDVMSVAKLSGDLPFPIIADPERKLATDLGIMDPEEKDKAGIPVTCRAAIYIGPDRRVKGLILYPATVGRNFKEVLRALDALQLAEKYPVATPEGWFPGDKVMVQPTLTDEEAKAKLPKGFEKKECPSGKNYLRYAPDPSA